MKTILLFTIIACVMCDPFPTGGAVCKEDDECGEGFCIRAKCQCPPMWTNPDCSYLRKSKGSAASLEALGFFGIAGIGRIYLGYYIVGAVEVFVGLLFVWVSGLACIIAFRKTGSKDTKGCVVTLWMTLYFTYAMFYIFMMMSILELKIDANGYDILKL